MELKSYKRQLKKDLRDVIKECKAELKGAFPYDKIVDLEGKIYAYEFVLKELIDTVEIPEK